VARPTCWPWRTKRSCGTAYWLAVLDQAIVWHGLLVGRGGRCEGVCLRTNKTCQQAVPHRRFSSFDTCRILPSCPRRRQPSADRLYAAWATPDEHVVIALDRIQGQEL